MEWERLGGKKTNQTPKARFVETVKVTLCSAETGPMPLGHIQQLKSKEQKDSVVTENPKRSTELCFREKQQ